MAQTLESPSPELPSVGVALRGVPLYPSNSPPLCCCAAVHPRLAYSLRTLCTQAMALAVGAYVVFLQTATSQGQAGVLRGRGVQGPVRVPFGAAGVQGPGAWRFCVLFVFLQIPLVMTIYETVMKRVWIVEEAASRNVCIPCVTPGLCSPPPAPPRHPHPISCYTPEGSGPLPCISDGGRITLPSMPSLSLLRGGGGFERGRSFERCTPIPTDLPVLRFRTRYFVIFLGRVI